MLIISCCIGANVHSIDAECKHDLNHAGDLLIWWHLTGLDGSCCMREIDFLLMIVEDVFPNWEELMEWWMLKCISQPLVSNKAPHIRPLQLWKNDYVTSGFFPPKVVRSAKNCELPNVLKTKLNGFWEDFLLVERSGLKNLPIWQHLQIILCWFEYLRERNMWWFCEVKVKFMIYWDHHGDLASKGVSLALDVVACSVFVSTLLLYLLGCRFNTSHVTKVVWRASGLGGTVWQ